MSADQTVSVRGAGGPRRVHRGAWGGFRPYVARETGDGEERLPLREGRCGDFTTEGNRAVTDQAIQRVTFNSEREQTLRSDFIDLFRRCPIPAEEMLSHLGLFLRRQDLTRILFINELYQKILPVHGVVLEFGVRWGQNLALFESLRGIHEPYNHNRKVVGFDTFAGFPSVHAKDGNLDGVQPGAFSVTPDYDDYLRAVLDYHEQESPVSHLKKYELVKGDATITIDDYLARNPETIVAMAYFDFDIYEPTKHCLEAIKPHLTRGSVIGFDELNVHAFPGETEALKEVFGLDRYAISRSIYSSSASFIVLD